MRNRMILSATGLIALGVFRKCYAEYYNLNKLIKPYQPPALKKMEAVLGLQAEQIKPPEFSCYGITVSFAPMDLDAFRAINEQFHQLKPKRKTAIVENEEELTITFYKKYHADYNESSSILSSEFIPIEYTNKLNEFKGKIVSIKPAGWIELPVSDALSCDKNKLVDIRDIFYNHQINSHYVAVEEKPEDKVVRVLSLFMNNQFKLLDGKEPLPVSRSSHFVIKDFEKFFALVEAKYQEANSPKPR